MPKEDSTLTEPGATLEPFRLLPGRTYSISHILDQRHPEPDADSDQDVAPRPASVPPFTFNREKLTLEVRTPGTAFDLDLSSITASDGESPMPHTGRSAPQPYAGMAADPIITP